jgi:hypothetical protein
LEEAEDRLDQAQHQADVFEADLSFKIRELQLRRDQLLRGCGRGAIRSRRRRRRRILSGRRARRGGNRNFRGTAEAKYRTRGESSRRRRVRAPSVGKWTRLLRFFAATVQRLAPSGRRGLGAARMVASMAAWPDQRSMVYGRRSVSRRRRG